MQTSDSIHDPGRHSENKTRKRFAVIGGGASGLVTLKSLLEVGLDAYCYERSDAIGGVWKFREEVVAGLPSIMRSTVANTSKEMSAFSDFPPPPQFPNFMPRVYVHSYLESYATVFGLMARIYLNHQVVFMSKTRDHEATGRWLLSIFHNGEIREEVFDGVTICTGLYTYPNMPELQGMNRFQGQVIHSHDYKDPHPFVDKHVLIIGLGNSSADIAVELSSLCKAVFVSVRRKTKIYPRTCQHGIPFDYSNTRWHHYAYHILPKQIFSMIHEYKTNTSKVGGQQLVQRATSDDDLALPSVLNDQLAECIRLGRVIVHGKVERLSKAGVFFKEEPEREHPVDVVIMATGYLVEYPFYPSASFVDSREVTLYKNVFPVGECSGPHVCLAVIGLFRVIGASFPVSEMQARWVAFMFAAGKQLPSNEAMRADIERQRREARSLRSFVRYQSLVINFLPYMDELASYVGAKPNLLMIAFTDPRLFRCCYWGPLVSYQYRLQGSHAWAGARDAILAVSCRMRRCVAGSEPTERQRRRSSRHSGQLVIVCSAAIFLLGYWCRLLMPRTIN